MRRLLLSAALAFLAAPALAQPDNHRDDHPHERPQNQGQARPPGPPPAQPGVPPAQQPRGGNGGPTNFTNHITGSPPGGQGLAPNPQRGDRGDRRGPQPAAQPQPAPPPAAAAAANRGNRGNHNDQGTRGNWQGQQGGNNNLNNNRGFNARGGAQRDYRNYNNFHRSIRADRRFRVPAYRRPAGWYQHRWNFGEFLPAAFWARDYWLMNFAAYDLPPPPYGAVWVREGSDALLVDQDSGEIITVEYDVFY